MKCPLCQLETRITNFRNIVTIDDNNTPHLYREYESSCMNEKCENYKKVVDTTRDEQPIG